MHTNALIALALAAAAGHAAAYPATGPNARRAAFDAFASAQGAPGAPAALAPTAATGSVVATPLAAATPATATAVPTTTAAAAVGAGSGAGSGATTGATMGSMGPGSDDMASILSQVEQFIDEISGGQAPGASAPPSMTQQSKRDTAPAPADGSEALGLDTVFKVGKALFHGAEALFGGGSSSSSQKQRRALLTQSQLLQAEKSQPPNDGLYKVGNTVYKVVRDGAPQPEGGDSEALGLDTVFKVGKAIFHGAEALFGGSSDSSNQQKREFLTLLARDAAAAAADPSGSEALGLDTIFKVGKAVFHGAEALFGGGDSSSQSSKRAPFGLAPGAGFPVPAETGTLAPNDGMHPGPKMFPTVHVLGELN